MSDYSIKSAKVNMVSGSIRGYQMCNYPMMRAKFSDYDLIIQAIFSRNQHQHNIYIWPHLIIMKTTYD